jgi:hypothetical protein
MPARRVNYLIDQCRIAARRNDRRVASARITQEITPMDVPLKFAIPLLLAAALPAVYAVAPLLHAAPAPQAATPDRPVRVAAQPKYVEDEAALAREADAVNEAHRARLAAAQAERDREEFERALLQGNQADRAAAAKRWKDEEDRQVHAGAERERAKLMDRRAANCSTSRWHCDRP